MSDSAIERYRYMLRTAPPDAIEQAHEEAFRQLTPEQRREALAQLSGAVPPQERASATEDPKSLARLATRTEFRQPGMLERLFGGGSGMGGMFAGSLLASLAGSFIGSSIAQSFFHDNPDYSAQELQDQGGEEAISEDTDFDDGGGFDGGDFA